MRDLGDSAVRLMAPLNSASDQMMGCFSRGLVLGAAAPTPALRVAGFSVPTAPASVGLARTIFKAVLESWKRTVDVEAAVLLLSELVTNALVHGVPPSSCAFWIGIEVVETLGGLHVEVHDPDLGVSGGVNLNVDAGDESEGGRGLSLVDALASSWGERSTPNGKCVYFDLLPANPSWEGDGLDCTAANSGQKSVRTISGNVACRPARSLTVLSCRVDAVSGRSR